MSSYGGPAWKRRFAKSLLSVQAVCGQSEKQESRTLISRCHMSMSRVRDLAAPMHLGLYKPALCAPCPIRGAQKLYVLEEYQEYNQLTKNIE